MDLKHTPTPWKLDPHLFGQIESQDETKLIARAGRVEPVTDLDQCERAANAEFIVRACNSHDQLVAALWHAEAALSSCYDMTQWPADGTTDQDKALSDVRAALAAAGAA